MNVYMTEEEQLELIKKWWHRHGNGILSVIIVIMLSYSAMHWWQSHQLKIALQASNSYELLMQDVASGDDSGTAAQVNNLTQDYPNTVYAAVAALLAAKQAVYRGDYKTAMVRLDWVIGHHNYPALQQIARIRAARIKKMQRKYPDALQLLSKIDDSAYLPLIYETRGDIELAAGNQTAAKDNYRQALQAFPDTALAAPILQMKLNDLVTLEDSKTPTPALKLNAKHKD